MQAALTRQNLLLAWKRVKAHKGAAGVDGLDIEQTAQRIRQSWPDKAFEARSYSFARYADDCNVYVGSQRAGERVMAYLRKLYAGLKLQINEAKSAVASAFGRKFPGYALWVAKGREVKCAVAHKALDNFKARIRQLTRRSGGRSMEQVVEKLRPYLLGWKAYFGLAQTPRVWRELDEWLRHRLRAISSGIG